MGTLYKCFDCEECFDEPAEIKYVEYEGARSQTDFVCPDCGSGDFDYADQDEEEEAKIK